MKIEILEENKINYLTKFSKAKKMRLRYNREGVLVISYPHGCKRESIVKFVENNMKWIFEKKELANEKMVSYENGAKQFLFGKKISIIINLSKTKRIDYLNDILMVSTNKLENVSKEIIAWRFEQAELVFQELLYQCFNAMKKDLTSFPKLEIKKSRSKWGCCFFNENKIMLNVALTQVPFYLIEYVVFHELTHFIYHNHSKEFHQKLQEYVPNERICMKELKKYTSYL